MTSLNDPLTWYEASLPSKERKQRGHFSTPPPLVEQILDACSYTSEAELMGIRVLDPACGGGNFLVEAARRLVTFGSRIGLDQEAQATLLQRNLWGFDPDPVSCFLAEMQLRGILARTWQEETWHPITQGVSSPLHYSRLHIHQADGLALPWEPCVDLFVANPPYLAAKNTDLSGYQSTQGRGQADSYLLFLSLALQVVRPGGWIGLVLPDPVLARANAKNERARFLKEATVHHLWHLSGVFPAGVGAVVIIAQKCLPQPMHHVSWVRGKWQPEADTLHASLPQSLLLRQPGAELRYLLSSTDGAIIERLRTHLDETFALSPRLAPLSEFLSISRGEELGKDSPYITQSVDQISGEDLSSLPDTCGGTPTGGSSKGCCGERPGTHKGPASSTQPPRATTFRTAHRRARVPATPSSGDGSVMQNVVARGGVGGGWALAGARRRANRLGQSPSPTPGRGISGRPQGSPLIDTASQHVSYSCTRDISGVYSPDTCPAFCPRPAGCDYSAYYPVLRGGVDICPYKVPTATHQIAREAIAKPLERYLFPKLLVVKSTDRLQATLDMQGHVALQTLYLLHLRTRDASEDDLYFFLALLNSRLLQKYVYVLHTAYKWVQPQIEQSVLARLPIPVTKSPGERQQIIELSRRLVYAYSAEVPVVEWKQDISSMYEEQERAICALYDSALPGLFADTE